jgi:hypothetical protein
MYGVCCISENFMQNTRLKGGPFEVKDLEIVDQESLKKCEEVEVSC